MRHGNDYTSRIDESLTGNLLKAQQRIGTMITENFKKWACSLSGCDGGNLQANIWLCGIEWGGGDEKYYQSLISEIGHGKYIPSGLYEWKEQLKFPFGRSLAKLYAAIHDIDIKNYREYVDTLSGNELLKLNLYPIAFRNTDESLWKQYKLDELTGFEEKCLFKTWCFLHRFPAISKIVKENSPQIIIGTGIGYLIDFFVCFANGSDCSSSIHMERIGERTMYWGKIGDATSLFVIPFFSGIYGLNSDILLQHFGTRIREISGYKINK